MEPKRTLIHSIKQLEFPGFLMRTGGLLNLTLTRHIENNEEQRKTVHKLHNMLVYIDGRTEREKTKFTQTSKEQKIVEFYDLPRSEKT